MSQVSDALSGSCTDIGLLLENHRESARSARQVEGYHRIPWDRRTSTKTRLQTYPLVILSSFVYWPPVKIQPSSWSFLQHLTPPHPLASKVLSLHSEQRPGDEPTWGSKRQTPGSPKHTRTSWTCWTPIFVPFHSCCFLSWWSKTLIEIRGLTHIMSGSWKLLSSANPNSTS